MTTENSTSPYVDDLAILQTGEKFNPPHHNARGRFASVGRGAGNVMSTAQAVARVTKAVTQRETGILGRLDPSSKSALVAVLRENGYRQDSDLLDMYGKGSQYSKEGQHVIDLAAGPGNQQISAGISRLHRVGRR